MTKTSHSESIGLLRALDPQHEKYATQFMDLLLRTAVAAGASDVHLQPVADGVEIAWRLDGVLQPLGKFPGGATSNIVTRLKVMASLLTYRTDLPQEGRIPGEQEVEMRVSTFPTLHGERAAVRLLASRQDLRRLAGLGLGERLEETLGRLLQRTSGALLVTGPAGSGKTTTLYACLREIVAQAGGSRSVITLEDPIEAAVDGVAQAQVNETAGLTLETGIRSLLRQDPEVLLVGEIRDRRTAADAMGAALTGHLVLSSFHAGSATTALRRLADMGIEPYMLRSAVLGVLSLRLARRLCPQCSLPIADDSQKLQLPVGAAHEAVGCDACRGTGYAGRLPLSQWLSFEQHPLPLDLLQGGTAAELEKTACQLGMTSLWHSAHEAVESGDTSPSEVRRVMGWPVSA